MVIIKKNQGMPNIFDFFYDLYKREVPRAGKEAKINDFCLLILGNEGCLKILSALI